MLARRMNSYLVVLFFFQAEDGIRDLVRSRGLGDVYKRQVEGNVGYEVLAPLRLGSGAVVLIDRGWIPLGERGARDIPRYAPAPQLSLIHISEPTRPY